MDFVPAPQNGSALGWFAACAVAGLLIDLAVIGVLSARARTTGSKTLHSLAESVRWFPTSLGLLAGALIAERLMGLEPAQLKLALTVTRAVAVVVITAFTARILSRLVRAFTMREDTPIPAGTIFVNLTRGAVWVVGALMLLSTLNIAIAPLITALGVGGLAVGLALQPTLENLFSGIQLLTSGQIKPGDFIRLDTGDEGIVLDVNWRNTTVQRPSNDVVIVPNSVLARSSVTNFSTSDPEFVLLMPVSFASAGDPDDVARITLEVAREVIEACDEAVKDQEPGVRFAELTPPAAVLNATIRVRTYQDRIPVRDEFVRRLAKRFSAEGVEAPPVPLAANRARA